MFTGIVEELGTVEGVEPQADAVRLTVQGRFVTEDARLGDSIAVDGCCLTVAERDGERFTADVMAATLAMTTLGALAPGAALPSQACRSAPRWQRRASQPRRCSSAARAWALASCGST